MEYRKTYSAPKLMLPQGKQLSELVDTTMARIAQIVGATLGPGGQPVLLSRGDDLPPDVTKDGVSVFKALGFADPLRQAILEVTRMAAVRTANEAGDGTTTATILAEAIGRFTRLFVAENPGYSPHRVVREVTKAFTETVEPFLRKQALEARIDSKQGKKRLRQVALISANGDAELADAVMQCYDICGDEGNVTLAEAPGRPALEVEEIKGYPMPTGYEESCGPFYSKFLREPALHRTVLKRPFWILYFGQIHDLGKLEEVVAALGPQEGIWAEEGGSRDVVLVAPWFSEQVLINLSVNFRHETDDGRRPPRIFPLKAMRTTIQGSERAFLDDLAAVTGATVYDDLEMPLSRATFAGLGAAAETRVVRVSTADGGTEEVEQLVWRGRTERVEIYRAKSFILGRADDDLIELRTEELRAALPDAASKLEASYLVERIARLGGGIARLTVRGPTNGETHERRDRAEDAVSSVRGAIREGVLYGGGWGLARAANELAHVYAGKPHPAVEVLAEAMLEPFHRLLSNVGLHDLKEHARVLKEIVETNEPRMFDALKLEMVDPRKEGIYDSVPAVIEALRSALSIATMTGTLGGLVVHARDIDLERAEASAVSALEREVAAGRYRAEDHEDAGVLPDAGTGHMEVV